MVKPVVAFHGLYKNGRAQVLVDRNGVAARELQLPSLRDHEARHSPSGFAWGYHGSGPAELARAILMTAFPGDPIVRHPACYEHFKQDVIAALPYEFRLTLEEIRAWRERWDAGEHARRLRDAG